MTIEIKVPPLPESVSDATLIAWHKVKGESVSRDENLVDLETDKVVLEVPAPESGIISEIIVPDGKIVKAGDIIAILQEGKVETNKQPKEDILSTKDQDSSISKDINNGPVKVSPAVRRLLEEHDLEISMITGTGKDGRISKTDVIAFLKSDDANNILPGDSQSTRVESIETIGIERIEHRVPMTRLRAKIAERMVDAQKTTAMLTTFNEVDLTEVISIRKGYKDSFEKKHKVKLGFMSFFAKAAVEALKNYPIVNASVESEDIIYHNYFDIGIAVSSDRGLMVPVIRDVDQMSFAEFEIELNSMAKKAQTGTISIEDLTGGTFTITNGGIFGSMMSTPILNQPQSAILGMHSIQQRPVVINNDIVARPMMYLALTYDHRIIDGKEAVQFLVSIKQQLEDPARLLLEI
jgi:2-oxoglutarate dehydrogenase E2 component (dihydrolipoamide succinyltransferase)